MSYSSYAAGFRDPVLLKEVPIIDTVCGNVFWVDSVNGGDGNSGKFQSPLATLDAAINQCSPGDRIYLKPGHSESISTAGGITCDVAGIQIIGTGNGSRMSQIKIAADVDINITQPTIFKNVRFTAAFADIAAGIDIDASDVKFYGCRFDESATNLNWVIVCTVGDGFNNFEMIDCDYIGNDAANDTLVAFAGTHTGTKIIGNRMFHLTAQAAAAAFITSATAQFAMILQDNFMHTETAAITANGFVVLAGTTNNGLAQRNILSSVDTDLTNAQVLASFDVTGLCSIGNAFSSGVADTYALTDSWNTIEDLT